MLKVNGERQDFHIENGYAKIKRSWSDAGKVAIQRGPLVYCIEEADNGAPLTTIALAAEPQLTEYADPDLLGGCVIIEGDGLVTDDSNLWLDGMPYRSYINQRKAVGFKAIPYYLWGNRQAGEMRIWLHF
ncbi:hypothetical protein [Paenibacillus sp. FSL R5-0519]|uniref:hypothetical protein n=1 Tax=Paenibacillus sp. FSL R5-0519 TaxID=2921648 RepID=UPI0030D7FE17